ncbi:hypothetical protein AYI69_g516 [Smittium culicis]|uniref:Uncharacterized protein n=1 Tax=Smittium culicis TaxID=133412 RepID=A0A1R1YSS8_9FUNG|nr:hypothetical protein AYI69_g516 [Smittium culicis]
MFAFCENKNKLIIFGDSLSSSKNNRSENTHLYQSTKATNGPVWNEYAGYFSNHTVLNYAHIRATTDNDYIYKVSNVKLTEN